MRSEAAPACRRWQRRSLRLPEPLQTTCRARALQGRLRLGLDVRVCSRLTMHAMKQAKSAVGHTSHKLYPLCTFKKTRCTAITPWRCLPGSHSSPGGLGIAQERHAGRLIASFAFTPSRAMHLSSHGRRTPRIGEASISFDQMPRSGLACAITFGL